MMEYWNEPFKRGDLQKRILGACENVEPKIWPHNDREHGSFFLPVMDDPPHLGIIIRQQPSDLSSTIQLPGGLSCSPSPRTTMLDQASMIMGIQEEDLDVLGYLSLYPLQDVEFDAHIFIGWTLPMEEWQLDPEQIDKAFKIPLEYFLEEFHSTQFDIKYPHFSFQVGEDEEDECSLNDATARIISTLVRRVILPA